jgi:pimeloyl-ACP methyl ester carboxylesterase
MPYVELDGKQFYYAGDSQAEGTPVIFCHGSGGGHHHWLYQLKGLKGKINPLAVDLPGHGRSEGEPADEIAVYRDWLHRFAGALGIGPFVAAGHSMGGAIALDYALHYPENTLGLILVGSGARLRVLPAFLETLQGGVVPAALADFLYCPDAPQELLQKGREEVASTAASVYHADLSACDKFDVTDKLAHISRPVIMICGSEDRLTPVKYSHYLAEKLPSGKVTVIDGAGHMVMLEKPEAVNRAIEAFIADLE